MRKFILRITIILVVIISLPISFLIIRQLSDLTENEKIVKGVFEKQIETILYTLNQTSDNIIKLWINRIDLPIDYNSDAQSKIVNFLFENNLAIHKIEFVNINRNETLYKRYRFDSEDFEIKIPEKQDVENLKNDLSAGYQRIGSIKSGEFTILYFLSKNRGRDVLGFIFIKTKTFIEQNLGTSFEQVAQQSFNIKATSKNDNKILYSVGPVNEDLLDSHTQPAWYLPGIEFSIQLRSATIDSLIKERSKRENYIFIGVLIIVLFGILFVILSIRKEIFLSEMKSEFVSNVSHEIRTPLALISMYAETLLLKRLKTKEKETEYLSVIHLEAQRLSEMVNKILTFSKMEKNKRTYHLTEIDLNSIIEEVIYTYSSHLKSMDVEYKLDLDPEIPTIRADREAVVECLINLLDNSVKYGCDTGKMVSISTFQKHERIFIEVEDNGIGISKKHQKHIFEKFYRVTKGNLAHKAKGTGLGLNIVLQIMENHGGKVKVKSALGEGSCFSLVFPLKKTEMIKILVIEDEPAMLSGLHDNLEFEGYNVESANRGDEGFKKILKGNYDLILLDVMLPGMSGFDILKQCRSKGITTPVIMLTAKAEELDKVLGLEFGADDYITKPFSLRELLARIKAILRRSVRLNDQGSQKKIIQIGRLMVNFENLEATENGEIIKLSHKEFEILNYLYKKNGQIVSRDDLLDIVWGMDYQPTSRTVDNFILHLRQKIDTESSSHIVTVHGYGYKLIV